MKLTIISKADYKTSTWSGGETTELFLFPPSGDYAKQEFDFRLSTATVELEESDFTSLPGFERLIMSLDKPLELHHRTVDELRIVRLKPFEVDQFSGSDLTKSFGKCKDFNLIYSNKKQGGMKTIYTSALTHPYTGVTYIYYALKDVVINVSGEKIKLNKGKTLVVSEISDAELIVINSVSEGNEPSVIEVSVH
ncbi:HutD family protein [Vagococcus fluvialis]|uniref:HutD/Ves family protein n=1 Tax=Vagococcus fluvialis TaxID=2738 RepID=UPI001A8CBDAB|nr:HutD family protein [Vagococcus fluvialis]MBO0437069.1 HutD family protein [Vagococcus fluvialis]